MSDRIITMCFWRRPNYAIEVLNALRRCSGIESYKLLIHLDGNGHPDMPYLAASVDFCERIVVKRDDHLGCNDMTRIALHHGFSYCDYVIHVEEDVVLAPDALLFFEWASRFKDDHKVFTVGAWRHGAGWLPESGIAMPSGEESKASYHPNLDIWGWATWYDRWREMDSDWTTGDDISSSWDLTIQKLRGERFGVVPHISRAINIGKDGGVHDTGRLLSYWAGMDGFRFDGEYKL